MASWMRVAGVLALVVLAAGCADSPPDAGEEVAAACQQAREDFAAAPAPADDGAQNAFLDASAEAVQRVSVAIAELPENAVGLDDRDVERTLSDMAWQLNNFPSASGGTPVLETAHTARAAIVRLDRFAERLDLSECGAATWRPGDWRTLSDRLQDDTDEDAFRQQLNRLCAETFPNPTMLAEGRPLLEALAANPTGDDSGPAEDVKGQILARLNTLNDRPADAGRFIRDFSRGLPALNPSDDLDAEYAALLAAFISLESAVPKVVPRNPDPEFRRRVDAALEELEDAWSALEIRC